MQVKSRDHTFAMTFMVSLGDDLAHVEFKGVDVPRAVICDDIMRINCIRERLFFTYT